MIEEFSLIKSRKAGPGQTEAKRASRRHAYWACSSSSDQHISSLENPPRRRFSTEFKPFQGNSR